MKILHVEDVDFFTELIKRVCKGRSFEVENAVTLSAAHSCLNQDAFDLLLVDLHLPDSTGMDTVQELKRYGIPIVILTSDPTKEFIQEAAALGVADYISKDNLAKLDLPLRLQFVHQRFRAQKAGAKKSLSFQGVGALRPFLTCAVLA